YRRDVPDILRTGDVIIGVQAATTVLYDVEIHLTDAAHPNEHPAAQPRKVLIRPAGNPEAPWEQLGRWEDKLRLVSRPESALSEAERWAIDNNMTFQDVGYYRNSTIDFGAVLHADGTFTFGR